MVLLLLLLLLQQYLMSELGIQQPLLQCFTAMLYFHKGVTSGCCNAQSFQ